MPRFLLSAVFVFLSGAALASAQTLHEGSSQYTVTQNNKHVGDAQVTITPISGGYTLSSDGSLHLDKFSYSFGSHETVDAQGNLVRDTLTGSVHGAKASGNNIQFDTVSDSTGRSFNVHIVADGKQTTNTLDRHRNTVLVPDLDPAAYKLMAHIALTSPRTAWVLIPKQNGILVPADYQLLADLRGTLNGQNITVKHTAVALSAENSLVIELFYTATGDLLEADLNAQGLRIAQPDFKILDRPQPVAPPAGEAPQQNGQQGAAQGQEPGAPQGVPPGVQPGTQPDAQPGGQPGTQPGANQGQPMQPY